MTREELLDKAKIRVRKSSTDMLDDDISQLIDVALTDLKRIGVHQTWERRKTDRFYAEQWRGRQIYQQ